MPKRPAENFSVYQLLSTMILHNSFMRYFAGLAICLLLCAQVMGQTCITSDVSKVQGIASGIVQLGVPAASVAQTSYSVSLTGFTLGTYAEVFHAFAIAGFQGASNQRFYSLVVDQVVFTNQNTLMNFTMNYLYNDGTINYQTTWSRVKLSWLAVSTSFETTGAQFGNYIWASNVGISNPSGGSSSSYLTNSVFAFQSTVMEGDAQCGYINKSPPVYDLVCNGLANARFLTHLYIMGFQFNPSGSYTLAASALRNGGGSALTDIDEAMITSQFHTTLQSGGNAGPTGPTSGPRMLLNDYGTQLKYVKVAIVITIIEDISAYPPSTAGFEYSGIYMDYSLFNNANPVIRAPSSIVGPRVPGEENYNFFPLMNHKYSIYGLSSFEITTLPSTVTVVNYELSFPDFGTVLLQTDDVNYMQNVKISADFWNADVTGCNPNPTNMYNIQQKYLTAVPPLKVGEQNIIETSSLLNFQYTLAADNNPANPLSATVSFTNTLYFQNFIAGRSYRIDYVISSTTAIAGTTYDYSISVQGNQIISESLTTPGPPPYTLDPAGRRIGYIFNTTTPMITINLNLPRDAAAQMIWTTELRVYQFQETYDPIQDCCVEKCPANSGVNVMADPPTCVQCSAGLIYNSVTGSCQCQTGYYVVSQASTNYTQCYPCFAPLCQTCQANTPTVCDSCVTGATVGNASLCVCNSGFYQNGALCTACHYRCLTCSVGTVCNACSDTTTRNLANNCSCIDGYFDAGAAVCSKCSSLCKTCTAASTCTSCFTENNRVLSNNLCVCKTGFYQVVHSNGTLSCEPCDAKCTRCTLLPNICADCDASANRILGLDPQGHQICNCLPGFKENSNGQCVQSNCDADPYCSNCQTVLGKSICINCIAATNRVLVLPQQECLCKTGFFEKSGICTTCSSGCMSCTSATSCKQCVVSATNNNDGTCSCPNGYFFTTQPIRFCKQCPQYCTTCTSSAVCTSCKTNFALVNSQCACPSGRYINANGECVPCVSGCKQCKDANTCEICETPLLLQGSSCVSRCGPGYYQSGFVCNQCSEGCAACSQANICTFCKSGRLSYNGFCYVNCPSGSVASTTSNTCSKCNAPCATCTEHPSKCLTCESCCGNLFDFQCLKQCPVGTYAVNNTCQYCSYSCATCVGSATTCSSCPEGKILYNGACYDKCPYVMIGGICTFNCAAGLYKTPINECKSCDSTCKTCENHPLNCTSCVKGYSHKGVCVASCPIQFFGTNGLCKACNPECDGCVDECDNCINCAPGFYRCGAFCKDTCYPNQFPDPVSRTCITCNPNCKTCSSQTFCTTCANPQAVPVNGVCNDCSYPCDTCGASPSECRSCVKGFSLVGVACLAICPKGAFNVNGVCQCTTGYIHGNQCVGECPTGYGPVGGQCTVCATNCAACLNSKDICTKCINGYALDAVTASCKLAPTCQFGQYFSQASNGCARICPQNTYYYQSVCLTACLQGYQDNGVGGCVPLEVQTGCSYPYFLSNGVCISNCPASTYADSSSRVCRPCSSNCFSCLTNTFCYACNAGYDLSNGVCIASSVSCPTGQLRYNGVCYTSCPEGTCPQGNYCQRICPAGTWAHNGGCYRNCPTKYTTNDACVESCPRGTSLVNGICQVGSQSCPSGQFWDASSGSCKSCQYPCSECSLTASYCTACSNGLTLSQNLCVSTSNACGKGYYQDSNRQCQACPEKCETCISPSSCSTCAQGYNFNGYDCVKTMTQLKKLTLKVTGVSRRDNVAFVRVQPNIIPNGLSPNQKGNFFLVVPNSGDKISYVSQWLNPNDPSEVIVAVTYATFPTQSAVFLAVNAQQLANSYSAIGYTADASSFVSAAVTVGLPAAPSTLTIPNNAIKKSIVNTAELPVQMAKEIEKDIL